MSYIVHTKNIKNLHFPSLKSLESTNYFTWICGFVDWMVNLGSLLAPQLSKSPKELMAKALLLLLLVTSFSHLLFLTKHVCICRWCRWFLFIYNDLLLCVYTRMWYWFDWFVIEGNNTDIMLILIWLFMKLEFAFNKILVYMLGLNITCKTTYRTNR